MCTLKDTSQYYSSHCFSVCQAFSVGVVSLISLYREMEFLPLAFFATVKMLFFYLMKELIREL